jgi:polar amino acid transport system substrate-binding protein
MRSRIAVLVASGLIVGVAGCGARPISELEQSDAGSSNLVSQSAPAAEPAASVINAIEPDATIAAGVPGDIRARGLSMSSSVGYPPMEMFAGDGTTIIGLDPAIGQAIARVLGVKITITNEDFNAQIPGILTGRYDLVASSMSDTKEREQKVTFIDYVLAGAGMLVAQGNPQHITGPEQLCGQTVSVVDNGSSLALAEKYASDCAGRRQPTLTLLRFPR